MRTTWHGIPATRLRSRDGATALIADHGAHVLSWVPAEGKEALFLSGCTGFGTGATIRGGVPIIFPQFAERGSGKRHGFARSTQWRPGLVRIEDGHVIASYSLCHDDVDGNAWPYPFELVYEVAVGGKELALSLTIHNLSSAEWECHAALHTYLRVDNVDEVELHGLQGQRYTDHAGPGDDIIQEAAVLRIVGEVDRLYPGVSAPVALQDGSRRIVTRQSGFDDMVIWNPGPEKGRLLNDLDLDAHTAFLCVEAAAISHPVIVGPSQIWKGRQLLLTP
jgi:glucose-6-phosphate 1-epimerase